MSENLRRYTTVVFGLEHVIRNVPPGAWANASPCEGWTARDVAGHAMAVVGNVAGRAGLGEVIDVFADPGALAGEDPVASFRSVRNRYLEATDRPGALQQQISVVQGSMTVDDYIGLMCGDGLVHTWDIARAAGIDDSLDPEAVEKVYASFLARDMSSARTPGRYGAEFAVEAGASQQDKLIAFTGRDPNWRA